MALIQFTRNDTGARRVWGNHAAARSCRRSVTTFWQVDENGCCPSVPRVVLLKPVSQPHGLEAHDSVRSRIGRLGPLKSVKSSLSRGPGQSLPRRAHPASRSHADPRETAAPSAGPTRGEVARSVGDLPLQARPDPDSSSYVPPASLGGNNDKFHAVDASDNSLRYSSK